MEKIGIIAGLGKLPLLAVKAATEKGLRVYVFDLAPSQLSLCSNDAQVKLAKERGELKSLAAGYWEISLGDFSRIFSLAQQAGIEEVLSVGTVLKAALFQERGLDPIFGEILTRLPERDNDALLGALASEFEKRGLTVLSQLDFLRSFQAPPGCLTTKIPTAEERAELAFGYQLAKKIASLGIGQTVVVKAGTVLAVEAMEGTDATIRRGGSLAQGATAVKVSGPGQDPRFDLPVIGPATVTAAIEAGIGILAFEAGLTLLMEKEKLVAEAEAEELILIALGGE